MNQPNMCTMSTKFRGVLKKSRLVLDTKPPLDLTVVKYLLIALKWKREPHKVHDFTQKDKQKTHSKGVMNGLSPS